MLAKHGKQLDKKYRIRSIFGNSKHQTEQPPRNTVALEFSINLVITLPVHSATCTVANAGINWYFTPTYLFEY